MFKTFIKQIASLQMIVGGVVMFPVLVSLIYGEWYSLIGFVISSIVIMLMGFVLHHFLNETKEPEFKHSLAIAALGWTMVIVSGALPYYVTAWITPIEIMQQFVPTGMVYESSLLNFRNPLHCIFESTSAFTTTGLSMAYHEPSVGKTILFYRHFSNWIGGAGFIVMALAIFKQIPGKSATLLYNSETSGTKLKATIMETARSIWKAYLIVSLFLFVLLLVGTYLILPDYPFSENLFDSLNHAMAGISTGGFSTLDDSIATYQSAQMDILYIFPMLIGSFSLPFFFRFIFLRKYSELWNDIQTRAIIIGSIIGSILLSIFLMQSHQISDAFRVGTFQFVSALSTTGWQTSNIGAWDDLSILFIVSAGMIVGGAAGGTVGGIKVIRALLLQKGLQWHINKVFHPKNAIKSIKFDHKILLPDEMNAELARAGIFTLLYLIFVFISTMITTYFMSSDFSLADALFESASAQGTVGLSTGITDPGMHPVLETVYIIQMLAGRLEIIPLLVLIRILFMGTKPRLV